MLSLIMFSIQTYNVLDYLLINYPLTKNLPSALIQYILNKKNSFENRSFVNSWFGSLVPNYIDILGINNGD